MMACCGGSRSLLLVLIPPPFPRRSWYDVLVKTMILFDPADVELLVLLLPTR